MRGPPKQPLYASYEE